ncbi:MAG: FAD-dependent oxidoreductase [Clostridia bacterium]|nr:FAD-dependent oxidoreductase [Clostridia bacterium]
MSGTRSKILISGISLPLSASGTEAIKEARRRLRGVRLLSDDVRFSLYKRSVDARRREDIRLVYSVLAEGSFSPSLLEKNKDRFPLLREERPTVVTGDSPLSHPPVVVGTGPCGLFCALLLAEHGYRPLVLERGGTVEERRTAVERLKSLRILDPDTNIQFGAGGAGTFSDGKLVTRVNDPLCAYVLDTFVSFGAPEEIRTLAKPHVGTDILSGIVTRMLERIVALGGEVRYHTRVKELSFRDGAVRAVVTDQGEIPTDAVVLAIGHSARDTYEMLLNHPFSIEPKPFSVGLRVEHLQEDLDHAMYGEAAGHPALGHAEYTLAHNTKERGVYTFCMCPGGEVVAAASEEGGVVVNGMSHHARDGKNANSAVVCSIFREDYGNTPMGAIAFQRSLERGAALAGGGRYAAPLSTVGDFLEGKQGSDPTRVLPTYMDGEGVTLTSHLSYLPSVVAFGLQNGLRAFGKQIKGFDAPHALLTGVETRTSAPVRILRGDGRIALGTKNVYPAGEGAGYAGGITSAAIDGIRTALALMAAYRPF